MTSDIFLTSAECAVLEALTKGEHEWLTPTEVAKIPPAAALHVQIVRSALKQLARYRLAERGGWGDSMRWGEFRITRRGCERVNLARDVRLVEVKS